jgi:hypothetical protein
MSEKGTHWRTFKTECDAHPHDNDYFKSSEELLFSNCEWSGEWEPFAAVTTGQTWEGGGGSQRAWTVWRRPCRVVDVEE